jgi:hypothetical protein
MRRLTFIQARPSAPLARLEALCDLRDGLGISRALGLLHALLELRLLAHALEALAAERGALHLEALLLRRARALRRLAPARLLLLEERERAAAARGARTRRAARADAREARRGPRARRRLARLPRAEVLVLLVRKRAEVEVLRKLAKDGEDGGLWADEDLGRLAHVAHPSFEFRRLGLEIRIAEDAARALLPLVGCAAARAAASAATRRSELRLLRRAPRRARALLL